MGSIPRPLTQIMTKDKEILKLCKICDQLAQINISLILCFSCVTYEVSFSKISFLFLRVSVWHL